MSPECEFSHHVKHAIDVSNSTGDKRTRAQESLLRPDPVIYYDTAADVATIRPTAKMTAAMPAPATPKRGATPTNKNPNANLPSPFPIITSLTLFVRLLFYTDGGYGGCPA